MVKETLVRSLIRQGTVNKHSLNTGSHNQWRKCNDTSNLVLSQSSTLETQPGPNIKPCACRFKIESAMTLALLR